MDPLSLLERKDKWFLGGGKGAIYAPPFPRWLESPGFWDESYFADIKLTRLFTVLFCESSGKPVRLRGELISWRPDRMIIEHHSNSHTIRETRVVTENHEWVSVFELVAGEELSAFVWSLPEMSEPGYGTPWQSLTECEVGDDSISYEFATSWPSEIEPDRTGVEDERISNRATEESSNRAIQGMLPPLSLTITLSANQPRLSHTVNLAQRHDDSPIWQTSLLPQKLRDGRLPGDFKLRVGPPPVEGLVHILQQYELRMSDPLIVSARVSLANEDTRDLASTSLKNVVAESERAWRAYFASVPKFSSSDPFLTNAYWYRWYGLRLNTVDIPNLPICRPVPDATCPTPTFSPFITEGIGFFRNFVTYSAQAHLREVAWIHSPKLAIGILENLKKCQREDGSFPGHNYSCRPARDFYHADFATGANTLEKLHPSSFSEDALQTFTRYALYLIQVREFTFQNESDTSKTALKMTAIFDQNETGQEYMSRYQAVSATADQWSSFSLGGTDATTYTGQLLVFLASKIAEENFPGKDGWSWADESERSQWALVWGSADNQNSFFCDVLEGGYRSSARPAAGLYPLILMPWILQWQERNSWKVHQFVCDVLNRWLLNPDEFWLPKGFPASALSDSTFNQDAEWKEKRLNCPWNGRSWPMVNSHIVDALSLCSRVLNADDPFENFVSPIVLDAYREFTKMANGTLGKGKERPSGLEYLRVRAGEALMKAITLMFHDSDPARPNSYEHYDPITGTPSLYRGYDDYMHSWIVDLIMRHAVGVVPGEDHIDPLPLGVDWIECSDIPHPRGRMSVRIEGDKVVKCDILAAGT